MSADKSGRVLMIIGCSLMAWAIFVSPLAFGLESHRAVQTVAAMGSLGFGLAFIGWFTWLFREDRRNDV